MTDDTFETDRELEELLNNSISIWFQKDIEPFEVKLYADKGATKYFRRRSLPTQKIDSLNSDGTMEFSVTITHEMEILPLVKYWIPHLFILEPEWVKEMLEDDVQNYINLSKEIQ